ncbi:putative mannosyl phosphorylinositol ceramide synthase CSH1 [Xylariomycetidae sp. FL2044]|nr:putative mannosyl phosphorylinositol ceramide synthase CSH1 [Xylariomycetidae sp. FL2044]
MPKDNLTAVVLYIPRQRAYRALKILISVSAVALVVYILFRLIYFANLFRFFKAQHPGIQITQLEIAEAHNSTDHDTRPQVVPKILHQVFHNWKDPGNPTMPDHWQKARQTCIDLNPGWEFKLWNLKNSREFIEDEFPWGLETYDSYEYPIQRVDVIRYFALRYYGGIYIDLDNGCAESLEPLRYYPAFTTDGGVGALSNNILGGQPDHPFFHLLTNKLAAYNWPWYFPQMVVGYTSGQWYLSDMWVQYHNLLDTATGVVRGFDGTGWKPLHHILMDMREGADPWVFWTQVEGNSWGTWDSAWFGWVGYHIPQIVAGVVIFLLFVFGSCFLCVRCCKRYRSKRGYKQLPTTSLGA